MPALAYPDASYVEDDFNADANTGLAVPFHQACYALFCRQLGSDPDLDVLYSAFKVLHPGDWNPALEIDYRIDKEFREGVPLIRRLYSIQSRDTGTESITSQCILGIPNHLHRTTATTAWQNLKVKERQKLTVCQFSGQLSPAKVQQQKI